MHEVPDKIAVYFEIGNCIQNCKGCHSKHLQYDKCEGMTLNQMLSYTETQIKKGANCIVLMGGTTNNIPYSQLATIINELSRHAPLCLYSGSDDDELHNKLWLDCDLTWLKTGAYKEELGGLASPATNQRFYVREYITTLYPEPRIDAYRADITYKFRKKDS